MQLTTQTNTPNLVSLARQGSAAEYSAALQETGSAVLGNAIDVFCAMDRETANGRAAVDQLKDLKNSLIAHIERNQAETAANLTDAKASAAKITQGEDPLRKLQPAQIETLTHAPLENNPTRVFEHLQKQWGAETTKIALPALDPMSGIKKFLADLTAVQGLYTAAVMIPGPLSASIKSVAKELYTSNAQSTSSASATSHSGGAAVSLLGIGGFKSEGGFAGQSTSSANAQYERTTIDERIVPVLSELQDRLEQASVVAASSGAIEGRRDLVEHSGKTTWLGKLVFSERQSYTSERYDDSRIKRDFGSFEYQAAHLRLPETSISDYTNPKVA